MSCATGRFFERLHLEIWIIQKRIQTKRWISASTSPPNQGNKYEELILVSSANGKKLLLLQRLALHTRILKLLPLYWTITFNWALELVKRGCKSGEILALLANALPASTRTRPQALAFPVHRIHSARFIKLILLLIFGRAKPYFV